MPEVTRWRSGFGAISVSVATVVLVVLDLVDDDVRSWGVDHALTSATVTGLLVLLITVLVVDQVVDLRQSRSRARAVAAQGAIVLGQAQRSIRAVGATLDGSGERDDAEHDIRTYMLMLLVSGPLLIDAPTSRAFLEEAQFLGAQMASLLTADADEVARAVSADRLSRADERIRTAAEPLLSVLHPADRAAVEGADTVDGR